MNGILSQRELDAINDEVNDNISKKIFNKYIGQFGDELDAIYKVTTDSWKNLDLDRGTDSLEKNVSNVNVEYTPEQIIELTGIDVNDVLDRYSKGEFEVFPSIIEQLKGMKFVTVRPITYSSEIGVATEPGIFISADVLNRALKNREEGREPFEYGELDLIRGRSEFRIVTPEEKELLGKVERGIDASKLETIENNIGNHKPTEIEYL